MITPQYISFCRILCFFPLYLCSAFHSLLYLSNAKTFDLCPCLLRFRHQQHCHLKHMEHSLIYGKFYFASGFFCFFSQLWSNRLRAFHRSPPVSAMVEILHNHQIMEKYIHLSDHFLQGSPCYITCCPLFFQTMGLSQSLFPPIHADR